MKDKHEFTRKEMLIVVDALCDYQIWHSKGPVRFKRKDVEKILNKIMKRYNIV